MLSETINAAAIANRILKRPNANPDSDEAILARQYLRILEKKERIDERESDRQEIKALKRELAAKRGAREELRRVLDRTTNALEMSLSPRPAVNAEEIIERAREALYKTSRRS